MKVSQDAVESAVVRLGMPAGVERIEIRVGDKALPDGPAALVDVDQQAYQFGLPQAEVLQDIADRPLADGLGMLELLGGQPVDGVEQRRAACLQRGDDLLLCHSLSCSRWSVRRQEGVRAIEEIATPPFARLRRLAMTLPRGPPPTDH